MLMSSVQQLEQLDHENKETYSSSSSSCSSSPSSSSSSSSSSATPTTAVTNSTVSASSWSSQAISCHQPLTEQLTDFQQLTLRQHSVATRSDCSCIVWLLPTILLRQITSSTQFLSPSEHATSLRTHVIDCEQHVDRGTPSFLYHHLLVFNFRSVFFVFPFTYCSCFWLFLTHPWPSALFHETTQMKCFRLFWITKMSDRRWKRAREAGWFELCSLLHLPFVATSQHDPSHAFGIDSLRLRKVKKKQLSDLCLRQKNRNVQQQDKDWNRITKKENTMRLLLYSDNMSIKQKSLNH